MTVGIVDYGVGNLGSIINMFRYLGIASQVVSTPDEVTRAERLVLPGVGSFDRAVQRLDELGLSDPLRHRAGAGTPVLGVCLGMQLLGRSSEEGRLPGLGLVDARFVRVQVPEGGRLKVPHMGWNHVSATPDAWLLAGVPEPMRFYFAHSFTARCSDESDVIATTEYAQQRLVAVYGHGNVVGAQFHPEKSHTYGMQVLRNFAERAPV
jgi:glutamine amidotransferase